MKTVTPLFLGGAEPDQRAELRAPSIKGAMRFWYRAIDPEYKKHEAAIFGSMDTEQSGFLIKITSQSISKRNVNEEYRDRPKTAYLGFGPINKGKTTRPYLKSGGEFVIEIIFKPKIKNDARLKVEKSLWALLVFGGLGSRSRKGFGSLTVKNIQGAILPLPWQFKDVDELEKAISDFWKDMQKPTGLQEYTRWSKDVICVVVNEKENGAVVLEWRGNELHNYRSYYGDNPCNFEPDHDDMLNYLKNGTSPPSPPLRTAFGLPHNYFFTNSFKGLIKKSRLKNNIVTEDRKSKDFVCFLETDKRREDQFSNRLGKIFKIKDDKDYVLQVWMQSLKGVPGEVNLMEGEQKGRRASPLFLHIQELRNGKACIVATFLPAKLIPGDKNITIYGNRQSEIQLALTDNLQPSKIS